ncbi:MAG: hypothetical protein AB8B71_00535 [Paracoccaceae bacterium]
MDWLKSLALAAVTLPSVALADWSAGQHDDGALFYGSVATNPPNLVMLCVGPSKGGFNPMAVEAHEIGLTSAYSMRLEISTSLLPFLGEAATRSDVIVWVDGTGYQLPPVGWNILDEVWNVEIGLSDPLMVALRDARDVIAGPAAGPHVRFSANGLAAGLTQVTRYCVAEYERLGIPLPAALASFSDQGRGGDPLEDLVSVSIAQACPGGAQVTPNYLLRGRIDDDDATDYVLDWREVTCTLGAPQPFCGASMCSAEVFLSKLYPRKGRTENILALGVQLIPLNNGLHGVEVGGSLRSCWDAGRGDSGCQFIWYWTGSKLDLLR